MLAQTANLAKLAEHFPCKDAQTSSSYRRLQRFFKEVPFDYTAIARLIMHWFKFPEVKFTLDRTNWELGKKHINILMLAMVFEHVAIPIFWKALDNGKGNSKAQQRIELIEQFKTLFPDIHIQNLLADREFVGEDWFKWLNDNNIPFCIALRKNNVARPHNAPHYRTPVQRLFADVTRVGECKYLTKKYLICGQWVYLAAIRREDGLLIVASNHYCGMAILAEYRLRWQIETLFSCFKSRGLDLEQTHMTEPAKIEKWVAVLSVAFAWAYLSGKWRCEQKPLKLKTHGRFERSVFRVGLALVAKIAMCILAAFETWFCPIEFIHLLQ